jgi:hypothetical protein
MQEKIHLNHDADKCAVTTDMELEHNQHPQSLAFLTSIYP